MDAAAYLHPPQGANDLAKRLHFAEASTRDIAHSASIRVPQACLHDEKQTAAIAALPVRHVDQAGLLSR